jgi:hypothetical protein
MREFTKSMTRYTWAMSLFGLQQMVNIFRPGRATESFNNVTNATEDEFGDALKATFRAGDNLQQGFVDVTFGVLTLGLFDRGPTTSADVARQSGEALRQGGRIVSQTVDAVTRTVQAGTSAATGAASQAQPRPNAPRSTAGAPGREQGWGPMLHQDDDANRCVNS